MKATIFVLIMTALLLGSCSAEDDGQNSIEVSGKLVSEVTGEGIARGVMYVLVEEYIGSGMFGYLKEISSQEIETDEDGYFTANLRFKDKENGMLFQQINEELATGILDSKRTFKISELDGNESLIFEAREYKELIIKLKNTSPFDEEDFISISIFQSNTSYFNSVIYGIENFDDQNEPWGPPASENGLNPFWIGDNVDSNIYGHIQEGASYIIVWNVRKNGIVTEYKSDRIETISGEINSFEINY